MNYWEDIAIRREGFTPCRRRMPTMTMRNGAMCLYQVIDMDEQWKERVCWDGKQFYDLDGPVQVLYWKQVVEPPMPAKVFPKKADSKSDQLDATLEAWLVEHGPSTAKEIRQADPETPIGTIRESLLRLMDKGAVKRKQGQLSGFVGRTAWVWEVKNA